MIHLIDSIIRNTGLIYYKKGSLSITVIFINKINNGFKENRPRSGQFDFKPQTDQTKQNLRCQKHLSFIEIIKHHLIYIIFEYTIDNNPICILLTNKQIERITHLETTNLKLNHSK